MNNENNMLATTDEEHILESKTKDIRNLIYTIRGKQVMLDRDVAKFYHCETKYLNRVVKRNIERFPDEFCFQLTEKEYECSRCQFVTLNKNGRGQNIKYMPYAFTEHGITMLAGLLKSEIAVSISIQIIKAFIEMRKFLAINGQVFERLTNVEYKLLEHDSRFNQVFDILQKDKENEFKQKIFYRGQIWDSYELIIDIIKTAKQKIVLIDNKELYHCGASIKDLGKKCFGINKIEDKNIIINLMKNL